VKANALLVALAQVGPGGGGGGGAGGGPGVGGGGGSGTSAGSGPSQGPPGQMEQGKDVEGPQEAPRSAKLFDSKRTTQSLQIDLGPIYYREAGKAGINAGGRGDGGKSGYERGTGELRLGVAITTSWKPFYLTGYQQTNLRVFDGSRAAWSIFTQQLSTGVYLGPFEPEVRIGFSLLTLDVFDGHYSIEAMSPRVAAAVGIHLGKIRLDIQTHTEYLWRWFGPDYLIRGVSLGLRLDVPRPKGPVFSESPSGDSKNRTP